MQSIMYYLHIKTREYMIIMNAPVVVYNAHFLPMRQNRHADQYLASAHVTYTIKNVVTEKQSY